MSNDDAPRRAGLRWARLGGVDMIIRPSVVIMALVLVALIAPRLRVGGIEYPYLIGGVIVLSIYVSVLIHELAHVLAARAYGMQVDSVTLHLLGGETLVVGESRRPLQELVISGVGPLMSGLLG